MNKLDILIVLFLFGFSHLSSAKDASLAELRRRGLLGKVAVELRDSLQRPASNVLVHFFLENDSGREKKTAITDGNGYASVEGRIRVSAIVSASAPNFHSLYHELFFLTDNPKRMNRGKWVPYETLIPLTIYEKRKPIKPCIHETRLPLTFNLESDSIAVCMPTESHAPPCILGADTGGDTNKMMITWKSVEGGVMRAYLLKVGFGEGGGICQIPLMDGSTGMRYPYELPSEGYHGEVEVEFMQYGRKRFFKPLVPNGFFWAFKMPVSKNENGESSFAYGIITEMEISFDTNKGKGDLVLKYCNNPTPNDRNSEFSVD